MADPHIHPMAADPDDRPVLLDENSELQSHGDADGGVEEMPDRNDTPTGTELVADTNKDADVGEAFIFRLPTELLVTIMELAASRAPESSLDGCFHCHFYRTSPAVQACCLVSKIFRDIAQPLLFKAVRLSDPWCITRWRDVLSKNVHLRGQCRFLWIFVEYIHKKEAIGLWTDISRWLTNIDCFEICGHIHEVSYHGVTKLLMANSHRLQHLTLDGAHWGNFTVSLMNKADFPQLKKLNLGSVDLWGRSFYDGALTSSLAPGKRHTSPLTSLIIESNEENLEFVSSLLSWPRALETFAIGAVDIHTDSDILPVLASALLAQKETLKSIDLSLVFPEHYDFDATMFPRLEVLKISRWHMSSLKFHHGHTKLLAPSIKIFVWEFASASEDQGDVRFIDFDEKEELWLHHLAIAAVGSTLQNVQINFHPYPDLENWPELAEEGFTYPWDRMDRVRDTVMRQNGICLSYNEPTISREEWQKFTPTDSEEDSEDEVAMEADVGSDAPSIVSADPHPATMDAYPATTDGNWEGTQPTGVQLKTGSNPGSNTQPQNDLAAQAGQESVPELDPQQTRITDFFPVAFHYDPKQRRITDFFRPRV